MIKLIQWMSGHFPRPFQAQWVLIATAFVIAMLLMDSAVNDTAAKLVTSFSGTLALIVGSGLLGRAARAMSDNRKPFAILAGSAGLAIFGVGIIEILVAGSTDYSKDLAAIVGAGILMFFKDQDD